MLMSEQIAQIIEALLCDGGGVTEIARNELAEKVGCVPSQINYVITSRFTPAKGYIVESRRGGGGYVRIKKIELDKIGYVMHFLNAINNSIDYQSAAAFTTNLYGEGIITRREAEILKLAISDSALCDVPVSIRNVIRASVLRHSVLGILNYEKMR